MRTGVLRRRRVMGRGRVHGVVLRCAHARHRVVPGMHRCRSASGLAGAHRLRQWQLAPAADQRRHQHQRNCQHGKRLQHAVVVEKTEHPVSVSRCIATGDGRGRCATRCRTLHPGRHRRRSPGRAAVHTIRAQPCPMLGAYHFDPARMSTVLSDPAAEPLPCAPKPPSEALRLQALRSYGILDTPREAAFEDITKLASIICQTPIALISLVDADRQWFKSERGMGERETPLFKSMCAHALLDNDVLVVPDTREDARFSRNPLVTGESPLYFYAGALLKTPDGLPLGTVCVLDRQPRQLTDEQIDALRALARQTMAQLELRRALLIAEESNRYRSRLMAIAGHDLKTPCARPPMPSTRCAGMPTWTPFPPWSPHAMRSAPWRAAWTNWPHWRQPASRPARICSRWRWKT